jgi:hypothetical protein
MRVILLSLWLRVVERGVTIADSYRAMANDIRRAAESVDIAEDVRRAYLALAELWWTRSIQLDGAPLAAHSATGRN